VYVIAKVAVTFSSKGLRSAPEDGAIVFFFFMDLAWGKKKSILSNWSFDMLIEVEAKVA
jgi:hypothetical protein